MVKEFQIFPLGCGLVKKLLSALVSEGATASLRERQAHSWLFTATCSTR